MLDRWLLLACSVVLAVTGGSCSATPKGALMLAISTDMQTPKDMSVVSVYVETNGAPKFDYLGRVLPDGTVALPATLAVIQPDDPSAPVRIRVICFQEQRARVLRDVLTTVPRGRTVLLRLPLDLIDDGSAIGTLPPQFVPLGVRANGQDTMPRIVPLGPAPEGITQFDPLTIMSICPAGMTSVNGQCVSETVDSSSLPPFEPAAVFGDAGVQSNGAPSACFDVATCLAGATLVANVDPRTCSFPASAGASAGSPPSSVSNLALVTSNTGVCLTPGQCFVPLVNDAQQGWTETNGVVTMIPGICKELAMGAALYAASGDCAPLPQSLPVCEPYDFPGDAGITDANSASPEAGPVDATLGDAEAGPHVCVPATCQTLAVNCGPVADGCGGLLQCGTCTAPAVCGGGGVPSVCGPVCDGGPCSMLVGCADGGTTALVGQVVGGGPGDPVPLVSVFVPSDAVQPLPAGPSCSMCGGVPSGNTLSATTTSPDGTFTLQNVPVGNIPLVIQRGKWRKETTVTVANACANNTLAAPIVMPTTNDQTPGQYSDIPQIAVSTGAADTPECVLYGMGIPASEFTTASGGGRIHLYASAADYDGGTTSGPGAVATPTGSTGEAALTGALNSYDMVVFGCWGVESQKTAFEQNQLLNYANVGGHVLVTHFGYTWLYQNGPWSGVANWNVNYNSETTPVASTIATGAPELQVFESWATGAGITSGSSINLSNLRDDVDSVKGSTVQWMSATDPQGSKPQSVLFTFDTPLASTSTCGRVAFTDFHVEATSGNAAGVVFPGECADGGLTPQQKVFEYMMWDLGGQTCLAPAPPSTCTARTCSQQGIGCGPAGNGCGGVLQCGPCSPPQTCGGGGFGKCG